MAFPRAHRVVYMYEVIDVREKDDDEDDVDYDGR